MISTTLQLIKEDTLNLRKQHSKDAVLLNTLVSEAEMFGKTNGNRETTEEETLRIIKKFKKNASETLKLSGKTEIEHEIELYSKYLPKEMSRDALTEVIQEIFKTHKNMGAMMKELNTNYSNINGKLASSICMKFIKNEA